MGEFRIDTACLFQLWWLPGTLGWCLCGSRYVWNAALWILPHSGAPANTSIELILFRSVIWATLDTAHRFCCVGCPNEIEVCSTGIELWVLLFQSPWHSPPKEEGYGFDSGSALCALGRCLSLTLSSIYLLHGSGIIYNGVLKGDF